MKIKRKSKNILKTVIICFVAFGLIAGSVSIFGSLGKNDDGLKEISPKFSVGGLTTGQNGGKYVETKYSIYTKEAFDCIGLEVTKEFDANVTYQVFYYDELDNFISASTVYSDGAKMELPYRGVKARIVITPTFEAAEVGEDQDLNIFDCWKYSRQITVKVSKNQKGVDVASLKFITDYRSTASYITVGKSLLSSNGAVSSDDYSYFWITDYLKVNEGDEIRTNYHPYKICFYSVDDNGNILFLKAIESEIYDSFNIPEGCDLVRVQYITDHTKSPLTSDNAQASVPVASAGSVLFEIMSK